MRTSAGVGFTLAVLVGLEMTACADPQHAADVWVSGANVTYSLDGGRPVGPDEAKARIRQRAATAPEQAVYIIADAQASPVTISNVCRAVRDGGLTNVIISVFESSANPKPGELAVELPGMAISMHRTVILASTGPMPSQSKEEVGRSTPAAPSTTALTTPSAGKIAKPPTDVVPLVSLPPYASELAGENEVRFRNPNDFPVLVAIRSGDKGRDLKVGAKAVAAVRLPAGRHDTYLVFATQPGAKYRGDRLDLPSPALLEIDIPPFVDGKPGRKKDIF